MKINEIVNEDAKWLRPKMPTAQDFSIARPSRKAIRAMLTREGPRILKSGIARSLPGAANILSAILMVKGAIEGDWMDVGLNATGIFFGPAVQLPAFAYQLARESYGSLFYIEDPDPRHLEKDLARDPERVKQNLVQLSKDIADELQAMASEARQTVQQSGQRAPKEFKSTAGGAAVGNPNIAAQGASKGATQ